MKAHSDDALDMIPEEELRRLFAARRPDAARFAAGVAARLDGSSEAGADGSGPSTARRPAGWLDRAASVLPGLSDGGLFAKSWTTILSLPALLLFGALTVFFRSHSRIGAALRDDAGRATSAPGGPRKPSRTLLQGLMPILGGLLGLAFLAVAIHFGGSAVINTGTLVILLSMAALAFQIGSMARERGATAHEVGAIVVQLQWVALFGCVLWVQVVGVFDGDSDLGYNATGWALCFGMVAACAAMMVLGRRWLVPAVVLVVLALLPSAMLFRAPDGSADAVRERLAAIDLQPQNLMGWEQAGRIAHVLEACGEATIDLSAVRGRVVRAIEDGTEMHPTVLTVAADLGLVDGEHWRLLAQRPMEAYRLRDLLASDRPMILRHYDGYRLGMLLATRDLTEAERLRLAARIDASWPDAAGQHRIHDLDQARACIEWLERLGRRDLVLAKTPWLHALLRRHWVGESDAARFSFPGGFTGLPEQAHADVSTTSTALATIERVGAPPEIPLRHVRAFLRHNMRESMLAPAANEPLLKMLARADHFLLIQRIGLPARGAFETLLAERMFVAALLLALLGLRAVVLAHRSWARVGGAMP